MKNNYVGRNLLMKDQAPRQRMLDEHDARWMHIAFTCLLTILLLTLLAFYIPAKANADAWKALADSSLVDMFGEE